MIPLLFFLCLLLAAAAVAAVRWLRRPVSWVLLAGATAVLITGISVSRLPMSASLFRVPATPLDLTNPWLARLWGYLVEVRHKVPEGASYTVLAPDRNTEMTLYMLSLGLLDRQVAVPSSYFGEARPEGGDARYVLCYGGVAPGTPGAVPVYGARDGAVYARPGHDR